MNCLKLRIIPTLISLLFIASGAVYAKEAALTPREVTRILTENFLQRNFDRVESVGSGNNVYEIPGGVHYAEALMAASSLAAIELMQDAELKQKFLDRYQYFGDASHSFNKRNQHVDTSVRGVVPFQLYLSTHEDKYLEIGRMHADYQWQEELPNGLSKQSRWWIDDIFMIGALQSTAYKVTGEEKYIDRAALTAVLYCEKIQEPGGLFPHAPGFPHHWARGNGWAAAGMAEVLRAVPEDHEHYSKIVEHYQKMMAALASYQSESGLWRQLIDKPESWTETSGTALFSYAMILGIKKGVLDQQTYGPAVARAWGALVHSLDGRGNLKDVCVGTGKSLDEDYYLNRPKVVGDLHGHLAFQRLANELISWDQADKILQSRTALSE